MGVCEYSDEEMMLDSISFLSIFLYLVFGAI